MLYFVMYHFNVYRGNQPEMDIISIIKTITKASKQTKTKTFCAGSEKNGFEWLHKKSVSIFLNFSYKEESTFQSFKSF